MAIAWDPALEIGDDTIDGQHRELFKIISELHSACIEGSTEECLDAILERLTHYTFDHFEAEQALMARSGYSPLEIMDHTQAHLGLRRKVGELIQQRQRGDMQTVLPVTEFLHDWLRTHIRQVDRKFVEFMRAQPQAG